jgi:hypothetical protein
MKTFLSRTTQAAEKNKTIGKNGFQFIKVFLKIENISLNTLIMPLKNWL